MHEFFLILFFPLLLAYGEQIPDYDDPYSPIFTDKPSYTWTDKLKMTIIAPSWNSNNSLIDSIGDSQSHPIKISTRDHSLEAYRFTETDVNTGVFTAEVILTGFLHDADGDGEFDTTPRTIGTGPTSGFLEVDRDSAITISFEFADGVVLTESVPVNWNYGTIQFSQERFVTTDTLLVRIVDLDMNLNPEALDHIPVDIYSDSDLGGIEIDAIETSESSGMFEAVFSLTHSSASSGSRLYTIPGDEIFASYDDYTLPKPYSTSDSITVETTAKIDSSIPAMQRLDNQEIHFTDSLGNSLQSFSIGNQMQIVGTLSNNNDFTQNFVYLFQVKDKHDSVESISWVIGQLSPQQILDVSQSWTPANSGNYKVESFVWMSLKDPTALGSTISKTIVVD